ncbi:hypothetical protein JH06_5187 [Blastocystis sp. subtype 4]|uniref:hypothetical protein n=1 Tax=Blastocystis sp. subtype 4 TaxID=944170 RepID=UPI0007114D08|nr:hypothetical protein JH06_5187 [Blastocystis sp. subtype 4]KNB43355.1 hypothetical protein JH06_5187 [Blastocystis sp. subtype 4]|eukprot:XP_014526798.1 hypothetical protein JH06_5187 [Blastocystis sp. subtype 4]
MFSKFSKTVHFVSPLSRLTPYAIFERFINVKSFKTPNPNVLKYETFPQMVILPEAYGKSLEIKSRAQARLSPLAEVILSIPEIHSVNMSPTSFSIAKKPSVSWDYVEPILSKKLETIS